jgi:hypothetical protein
MPGSCRRPARAPIDAVDETHLDPILGPGHASAPAQPLAVGGALIGQVLVVGTRIRGPRRGPDPGTPGPGNSRTRIQCPGREGTVDHLGDNCLHDGAGGRVPSAPLTGGEVAPFRRWGRAGSVSAIFGSGLVGPVGRFGQ